MPLEKPNRLAYLVSLGVLLLLIAAFFLGSRFPYFPRPQIAVTDANEEWPPLLDRPNVEVWISREGLFVWNHEKPAGLDQLPSKIAGYKAKHSLGHAEVSSEDMTHFDKVVYALAELKRGGFPYVTVATEPKRNPEDPY